MSAEFDSDGDGVPDIFRYNPEGWSNGRNAPSDGYAYDVPYLNYVASSDTDENGIFTTRIYFEQGKEYTVKYSHSGRILGDNDLDLTIITPDEKEIAFDLGRSSGEKANIAAVEEVSQDSVASDDEIDSTDDDPDEPEEDNTPPEIVKVKARLEILPPEAPCMIFYTFTAPQRGIYTFSVFEKEYTPASGDVPYELRIYEAGDTSALKLGTITMTSRDALDLQRVILSYADKFNADGLPVSYTPEFVSKDVYNKMLESIAEKNAHSGAVTAAADIDAGTSIKNIVYDVPYYSKFAAGYGFYADSGLGALQDSAFEKFTLSTPTSGDYLSVETNFSTNVIATEEEHDREQALSSMTTFAMAENALGNAPPTALNVRLGQFSRTVMVCYEVIETSPRVVDYYTLRFKQDAVDALQEGADVFREEYGDYFVGGYTWGMRFKASISITATTPAILNFACESIKSIMSFARMGWEYTYKIREFEAYADFSVTVDEMLISGSDPRRIVITTGSPLTTVANALSSFSQQVRTYTRELFVPLDVTLVRFNQIGAAKNVIPALLPVSQRQFNAVLAMTRSIFRARCYFNAVMSMPEAKLRDGKLTRDKWSEEFQSKIDSTNFQINAICSSEDLINSCKNDFDWLTRKYQNLTERYKFYFMLVGVQEKQKRNFSDTSGSGSIGGGYSSYSLSSAVAGDFDNDYYFNKRHKKEKEFLAFHSWTVSATPGSDWRFVWFNTGWTDTTASKGEDKAYPTLGSISTKWVYEGGIWRRVEWYLQLKLIHMDPEDYPFVGLKD